jgi:hypothetical protein
MLNFIVPPIPKASLYLEIHSHGESPRPAAAAFIQNSQPIRRAFIGICGSDFQGAKSSIKPRKWRENRRCEGCMQPADFKRQKV